MYVHPDSGKGRQDCQVVTVSHKDVLMIFLQGVDR
jgi:hypothetical protein